MGNWKLEVGRMTLYVLFPVAVFYIFNQPQYFEDWVIQTKRDLFPNDSEEVAFKDALQKFKDEQQLKYMKGLEGKRQ